MIDKDFFTYTKISGVTHKNDNNVEIQNILPLLKENGRIYCIRDYSNKFDSNAIKVFYFTKHESIHIGYIQKELAAEIAPFLDEHHEYDLDGAVDEITGRNGNYYGCNIRIWITNPDEPSYEDKKAFQEHLNNQSIQQSPKINNSYYSQTKNNVKLNKFNLTVIWILITIVIFFTICIVEYFYLSSLISKNEDSDIEKISDNLITLNEYEMLEAGMSRTDVYNVIGSFGEKTSETGGFTDEYHIEMYSYDGYGDEGANAQLMFVNGELDTMAQYGLEKYNSDWDIEQVKSTIDIENFQISYSLAPINILGDYKIEAICNNNSIYNIFSVDITAKINGKSEEVPIYYSNVIEAGESSEIFTSLGENKSPINTYEILDITIHLKSNEGNFYYYEYDYKTNESRIF